LLSVPCTSHFITASKNVRARGEPFTLGGSAVRANDFWVAGPPEGRKGRRLSVFSVRLGTGLRTKASVKGLLQQHIGKKEEDR
jgi:hypothetical protein